MIKYIFPIFFLLILNGELIAGRSKALLIGISQYQEMEGLSFADRDVLEVGGFLSDFSEFKARDINILTNQKATQSAIRREIDTLIRKSRIQSFDKCILMFAGHGRNTPMGNENTNIFFAPTDASISRHRYKYKNGVLTNDTFLTKNWVAAQAAAINSKKIILIFDACYSGIRDFTTLYKTNLSANLTASTATNRNNEIIVSRHAKKVAFIAASSETQETFEIEQLKHGTLTYCVLKYLDGVRQNTPDRQWSDVTVDRLFKNIQTRFDTESVKLFNKETGIFHRMKLNIFNQPELFSIPETDPHFTFLKIRGSKTTTQETGIINLETQPKGAMVTVDGKIYDQQSNCSLQLTAGYHRIELFIPETRFRHTFTRNIEAGKRYLETFNLYGRIDIESFWELENEELREGPPLTIFIDGKKYGTWKKLSIDQLISGSHLMEIRFRQITRKRKIEIRNDSPLITKFIFVKKIEKKQTHKKLNLLPI